MTAPSSEIASGWRKAQNFSNSAAVGFAFSMFSNESTHVLAIGQDRKNPYSFVGNVLQVTGNSLLVK